MFSISILILAGPCLISVMTAIALFIVHRNLSPVRHALVWSAAFAMTALRWGVFAIHNAGSGVMRGGLIYSLFGTFAILLLAEGFRLRASLDRARWTVPIIAAIMLPIEIAIHAEPATALRATMLPILSSGLLLWAATTVMPRDRRSSVAEITVIVTLLLYAALELSGTALALAEQIGLLHSRAFYIALYSATVVPVCAMMGMSTLLLIAFDFSAEQHRLIHTDPLTGILNRLGFERAAQAAIERRRRKRARPLAIALADIDAFKGVNDRYGHAVGDETLIGFARHLAARIGRDEAVGRIGGEEFVLLLPGYDGPAAFARIEPIRIDLAGLAVEGVPDLAVTASFGVAEHAPDEPLGPLIERADSALYQSKREGRNRSTLAPPGPG